MKKIVILLLVVLLSISFVACSKEAEPEPIASGLAALASRDEFAVYEDGEQILTLEEIEMTDWPRFIFAAPYSEYYWSKYLGTPFDFREQNITTKRGIKIGSSMEDIVAAYSGIEFYWMSVGFDNDGNLKEDVLKTIEELADEWAELEQQAREMGVNASFYTDTYFMIDGTALTISEFRVLAEENGWDYYNM
ncbi:hypothetical protein LJC56_11920, partial [Christensenellaceae bacterium OttesenSCG-928-K19]|nr:hypothetical protein [Christensenellaceae bacterium OttesenSCG-928-K19]